MAVQKMLSILKYSEASCKVVAHVAGSAKDGEQFAIVQECVALETNAQSPDAGQKRNEDSPLVLSQRSCAHRSRGRDGCGVASSWWPLCINNHSINHQQ